MQRVVQKWKDPLNGIRLTTDILFNPHLNIFFRDREKERERERESNREQLPPMHALSRGQTHKLGLCPDQE